MATGRPEVEVVLSADDDDLQHDLDDAETKILGMSVAFAVAGRAAIEGFGLVIRATRSMISWLETAEDKWEEFSKESRKHIRDYGKEIEDTKNQIVLAFGQIWDATKRPFEAELMKAVPPLEQISNWATVAAENIGTLSGELLKAYKRVEPLVTGTGALANIAHWLAFPAQRVAGRGIGIVGDLLGGAVPTEEQQETERRRLEALRRTEEQTALAERGRQMQEQLVGMAQGLGQFANDVVQEWGNTLDYSMSEFMRNSREGFREHIAELREDLQKELERAQKDADRAAKRQNETWERVRQASQALLDYQNRDPGFQASLQSITGLYSRIQTAAASRPAEDMTEKRLKERFAQAQKLHDEAKDFAKKENQKVVEAIKELDNLARFGT